ncbi:hypothetical protein FS749_013496 [Ceratobasidium sp. UAMH 11750]|nr:hypothetical protein FS749_013496 [Ceratobasidium sp. UAMH 11750]
MVGQPLQGHTDEINSVAYSPDGAYIASGSDDGTVLIWDAHTGQTMGRPFGSPGSGVSSVAFSPDCAYLVSGSWDNAIRVWCMHAGQEGSKHDQLQVTKPCTYSVCAYPSEWDSWELDQDGWVVTDQAEPLIWVPHNMCPSLLRPHNITTMSRRGSFQLDFSGAKLGRKWEQCYSG